MALSIRGVQIYSYCQPPLEMVLEPSFASSRCDDEDMSYSIIDLALQNYFFFPFP